MKRALVLGLSLFVIASVILFKSVGGGNSDETSKIQGHAMGSSWTLSWRGDAPAGLDREVALVLEHWEQVMSQWRPESDLSRFNRGEPATDDLMRVIRLAESLREASGGAFNHEILHDVHAAGHGPAGSGVDLSAIGKGFAADRVAEHLRQLGVREFIFEIGGDLVAGDGEWIVGIEHPDPGNRSLVRKVALSRRALATSGNSYQPAHIIDPKTGEPVRRPPMTVTVLAGDGATADAWATAIFVLGPEFQELPEGVEATWNR